MNGAREKNKCTDRITQTEMPVVVDAPVVMILYIIKLVRFMTLWIALYIADKVFQARYVSDVLFEGASPPTLVGLLATALAIEAVALLFIVVIMSLFKNHNKRVNNAYLIDRGLMTLVAGDYIITTAVFFALGIALCATASERKLFRYGEDGLRGIRAVSVALLGMAFVVILLLPAFIIIGA